ncbi:hypothetical protein AURDEDRAFT_41209, partial [Auricularia subglabra TFB-10046 SS5]
SQIARDLDMSKRVVECVLHLWKEIGDVCREPKRLARARRLSACHLEFLVALTERRLDSMLDEMQDELDDQYNLYADLSTIWRSLKFLGISNKRLSKHALERTEDSRMTYQFTAGGEETDYFVFVDESAIDLCTTYRLNGW